MEIRPADSSRIAHIAEVIGRAFVTEPMMSWPLGGRTEDLEDTVRSCWCRPSSRTRWTMRCMSTIRERTTCFTTAGVAMSSSGNGSHRRFRASPSGISA